MRVLITGGTGLIGRALAADLAGDGHDVVVLSRDPAKAAPLPDAACIERWDALTADGWGHLVDGADAIVNLAGENIGARRWTPKQKRRIRDSRLNAGKAVVQAVEAAGSKPEVVVQASGIGFYGDCRDDEVTEDTPAGDGFLARFAMEWEASTLCLREIGVRWTAIRTGIVLSRDGGALQRMVMPMRLLLAGRLGSGRQWFPWIHIEDEVRAIRLLVEDSKAEGPFNLAAPEPVTNAEFSRQLGRELNRPLLIPIPAFALRMVLGEMAGELLEGQRAVPQRLMKIGYTFRFPGINAALHDLLGRGG
jgi:uncharacterized protein (TIGR01777 family)